MKTKLFIAAALCTIAFQTQAQTEKGQNVVGIAASYSSSSSNDMRTWTEKHDFSSRLSYGHFFLKNLVVGITAGYSNGKSVVPSPDLFEMYANNDIRHYALSTGMTNTVYHFATIGAYIRHYVNLSGKFKLYSELTASKGFGKQSNEYYFEGVQSYAGGYRNFNTALNAGAVFFPTKRIGIELGINVLSYSESRTDYGVNRDELTKNFSIGVNNFRPMLGVNFHF